MTPLQTFKTSACLTALVVATPAWADVTAAEVWENWKSNFDIYGEDGVTIGSEEVSGGTITVSDLAFTMQDDVSSVSGSLGQMTFTENGDGTVDVSMSENMPIVIEDSTGATVNMSVSQSGLKMTASGEPDAISYDLTADRYAITVDEITEDGEAIAADILFAMNDVAGSYLVEAGDITNITYAIKMASADLLVDVKEPDEDAMVLVSGKMNDLFVDAQMALPEGADFDNPENLMTSGFAIAANYGLGSGNYIFEFKDGTDAASGTASSGATSVDIGFDMQGMNYNVLTKDVAFAMTVPDVPVPGMELPLDVTLAEYGIDLKMPLAKTEEPTDFALGINLTELAVNDEIWEMGDPQGQLPHDPVTLKLDLSGTAKLFFDLMDPEQADAVAMAEIPGELYSLTLNELLVSAVGAKIDGAGGFTFDNSDLATIPGFPRPEGEVTINIAGANALIDTLIRMGLLPEDQAMGARMMMGMFARSTGDDQLSSTVEVNAEGHVIANGQRIR